MKPGGQAVAEEAIQRSVIKRGRQNPAEVNFGSSRGSFVCEELGLEIVKAHGKRRSAEGRSNGQVRVDAESRHIRDGRGCRDGSYDCGREFHG